MVQNYFSKVCSFIYKDKKVFPSIMIYFIGSLVLVYLSWFYAPRFINDVVIKHVIGNPISILIYFSIAFLLIIFIDKKIIEDIRCLKYIRNHFISISSILLGGFIATITYSDHFILSDLLVKYPEVLFINILLFCIVFLLSKSINRISSV